MGSNHMDGSGNRAGNDVTTIVAREFQPTRIEQELLAQAFDLVCRRSAVAQEGASNSFTIGQDASRTVSEQPAQARIVGRRAA